MKDFQKIKKAKSSVCNCASFDAQLLRVNHLPDTVGRPEVKSGRSCKMYTLQKIDFSEALCIMLAKFYFIFGFYSINYFRINHKIYRSGMTTLIYNRGNAEQSNLRQDDEIIMKQRKLFCYKSFMKNLKSIKLPT